MLEVDLLSLRRARKNAIGDRDATMDAMSHHVVEKVGLRGYALARLVVFEEDIEALDLQIGDTMKQATMCDGICRRLETEIHNLEMSHEREQLMQEAIEPLVNSASASLPQALDALLAASKKVVPDGR